MLVSAGSTSAQATSPSPSSRSSASRSLISTIRVVSTGSTGGPTLPSRDRPAVHELSHRLVDAAVIAVVVDQDLRPAGDLTGQANHEAVRVGRRQRELPVGQAEPPLHLLADHDRVLGRQHRGDAAGDAIACDGRDRGRRGVARHRSRVAETEVRVRRCRRRPSPRAPAAVERKTGKSPGQRVIQFIGTPESSDPRPARAAGGTPDGRR